MSASAKPDRSEPFRSASDGEQGAGGAVIITVIETVVPALAGRDGCRYVSPPQPREQALALVRLLGGGPPGHREGRWITPVAGGRRVITLSEEPNP
jgi:hypothetical protein